MPSGYGPSAGEYVPSVVANGSSHRAAGKILYSFLAHGFGVNCADIHSKMNTITYLLFQLKYNVP